MENYPLFLMTTIVTRKIVKARLKTTEIWRQDRWTWRARVEVSPSRRLKPPKGTPTYKGRSCSSEILKRSRKRSQVPVLVLNGTAKVPPVAEHPGRCLNRFFISMTRIPVLHIWQSPPGLKPPIVQGVVQWMNNISFKVALLRTYQGNYL